MLMLAADTLAEPTYAEGALWAIIALPLAAFVLITLSFRRVPQAAGFLALGSIGVSCALSFGALLNVMDADGASVTYPHQWFEAGSLVVNLGVRLDGLTAVMLVVVTSVSLLVQLFSFGYME
ncbi:MAG: hypothetical protein ACE5EF_14585, partial [Dehalococcoidia bacterium]